MHLIFFLHKTEKIDLPGLSNKTSSRSGLSSVNTGILLQCEADFPDNYNATRLNHCFKNASMQ